MSTDRDGPEPLVLETQLTLTEGERQRQWRRSIAIAVMLGVLVVLFYLVTIVRIGGNVAKRAM